MRCSPGYTGQTLSRQLDVFARSLGRLLLEAMEDVDPFRSSRSIDRPVRTGRITHTNLAHTCSDRRHRLPVVRIESALDPEQLMTMSSMADDGNALRSTLEVPDQMTGFMLQAYARIPVYARYCISAELPARKIACGLMAADVSAHKRASTAAGVHTTMTRSDAEACNSLIWRAGQGDSLVFDSHHPLHLLRVQGHQRPT